MAKPIPAFTSVLLSAGVAALLVAVRRHATLSFDGRAYAALRGRSPQALRKSVAVLADPKAALVEAAGVALLAAPKKPRASLAIFAAPALALAACTVVKRGIDRARPPRHLLQRKGLESCPSSHTAGKAALLWMVTTAFPAPPRARALLGLLAAADLLVVAGARIADGAHWPTDTIAGAAIGIAAANAVRSIPWLDKGRREGSSTYAVQRAD